MKIKELLNSPEKWTKGVYARNSAGDETMLFEEDAVCFCMGAALVKCYQGKDRKPKTMLPYYYAYDRLQARVGNIAKWNDAPERTFAEVKAIIEELDL